MIGVTITQFSIKIVFLETILFYGEAYYFFLNRPW